MPKRKFIDKKNAVTFYLTNRPQRDPLTTDENAPKNILVPMDQVPNLGPSTSYSAAASQQHFDDDRSESSAAPGPSKNKSTKKNKDEETKYGIYFDDEYDYLQHLKDSSEVSNIEWDYAAYVYAEPKQNKKNKKSKPIEQEIQIVKEPAKLQLPSSMFESEYKEDIGLLNKAAKSKGPRPDLDPDIIEALDDDFNFEDPDNELEDNFIELANAGAEGDEDSGGEAASNSEEDSEGEDTLGSLDGDSNYSYGNEDGQSTRFTNYSMSSSVVPRSEQLTILDDRFEKMYEGYEDTEIGALDCEEIEGNMATPAQLLKLAEEFDDDTGIDLNEKITKLALKNEDEDSSESEYTSDEDDKQGRKWDCESIISTYSNTKNRPKLIRETSNKIKISGKTGMPEGVFGKGLTASNLKKLDQNTDEIERGMGSTISKSTVIVRNKDESPEEKRERKKLVREMRKERREERKANSEAFKDEKKRQEKIRLNSKVNVQGLKL